MRLSASGEPISQNTGTSQALHKKRAGQLAGQGIPPIHKVQLAAARVLGITSLAGRPRLDCSSTNKGLGAFLFLFVAKGLHKFLVELGSFGISSLVTTRGQSAKAQVRLGITAAKANGVETLDS